ncbi:DUF3306 domain-containing protein [Azospirillum sp. TSO22-1]|uniref:DUF3306 domain-containing protein n=1 Tax=Azospirillum sp. TSO22-1 TaxID=716789 RepID=UPI000D64F017|nr:DUF3306 domain-containing protein [Azospirillum sp. TSO22-1]
MTEESFLARWSRLKRQEAEPPPAAPEPVPAPPAVADAATPPDAPAGAAETGEPGETDPLKDLPPVESLTAESDFTPFLRAGVPEDLHRQALRKLWTSDPVFANDDGLKDYAGDYTGLFSGSGVVKTAYRVGKGFLDALEEVEAGAEDAAAPKRSTDAAAQDDAGAITEADTDLPADEGVMINKS